MSTPTIATITGDEKKLTVTIEITKNSSGVGRKLQVNDESGGGFHYHELSGILFTCAVEVANKALTNDAAPQPVS